MISYIINKKGKVVICEDSLTSSIFDLLKYLPIEQFWRILKNSLYHDNLPNFSGEIDSITFWDKWNSEGTNNKNFIEPDLFIRFKEFDLILEAKRYNENQQSFQQNNDQIISYYNSFEDEQKKLYYIQVGGLKDKNDLEHDKAIILKTDWNKLLDAVYNEYNQIKSLNLMHLKSSTRILEDLIKLFEFHQFYKKIWLKDFKISQPIKKEKYFNTRIFKNGK